MQLTIFDALLAPPPLWILWENVPGVFSVGDNAFGAFLGALVGSDAAIQSPRGRGWSRSGVVSGPRRCAAWRMLDSQHFRLAQRRERVFVLARGGAGNWDAADALLPVIESMRWHPAPGRKAGQGPARPIAAGSPGGSGYRNDADTADNLIAHPLRAQSQPSHRADSDTYIPVASTALRARDGKGSPDSDCTQTLVAFGGNRTGGAIDVATALNACRTASGRMDFESETFVVGALNANGKAAGSATQQDAENGMLVVGTLTSNGDAHSGFRNADGLVPVCVTGETTHTLTSEGFDASEDGTGRGSPIVVGALNASSGRRGGNPTSDDAAQGHAIVSGQAVRRLTVTECERLQGFPDGYTRIPTAKRRRLAPDDLEYLRRLTPALSDTDVGLLAADGPCYRALGNSMSTKVMREIGERISFVERLRSIMRNANDVSAEHSYYRQHS